MKKLCLSFVKRESGVTMTETAMLLPWLFIIIFGITEISFYLFSKNVVHYAAFMAARSAVVYGEKTLESINYPFVAGGNETDPSQKIAEATAEKIIFESLPWENKRIRELSTENEKRMIERVYFDGRGERGAVRIKSLEKSDSEVTVAIIYCMPIHFGLHNFFIPKSLMQPCKNIAKQSSGETYEGIPIEESVTLKIKS